MPAPDPQRHDFLSGILRSNAEFIFRRARWIIAVSLLLTLFSGWYAWKNLKFKTAGSDLIAASDEIHARFLRYQEEFRTDEDFVILISSPDIEKNAAAIEFVAEEIRNDPSLIGENPEKLFYKFDREKFRQRALFYIPYGQLVEIREHLEQSREFLGSGNSIFTLQKVFERITHELDKPSEREETARGSEDAVAQLDFLTSILNQMQRALRTGETEASISELFGEGHDLPYIAFEEGRSLVLLLGPPQPTGGFTPYAEAIERLRTIIERAREKFPEVRFGLTGEPVLGHDEQTTYQRDTFTALIVTIAVIFAVFAYAYRGVTRPLLKIAVLIASIVIALAYAAATVGHLNMLSVAFIVMIMGLGDDFAIYIITRYEEERTHGLEPREALGNTMVHAGHSVVLAALTTAISFGSMIFTSFLGLVEMGIIAGGGLIICAVLCLTFLPALLLQQRKERHAVRHEIKHRFTPILLRWERAWLDRAGTVLLVACALIMAALILLIRWNQIPQAINKLTNAGTVRGALAQVLRTNFDYDVLKLQNPDLNSVQTARELSKLQSIYFATISADSIQQAKQLQQELAAQPSVERVVSVLGEFDQPGRENAITEVKDAADAIEVRPSNDVQLPPLTATLEKLDEQLGLVRDFVRVTGGKKVAQPVRNLSKALDQTLESLRQTPSDQAVELLGEYQRALGQEFADAVDTLEKHPVDPATGIMELPNELRSRYIGRTGKYLLEIYPKHDLTKKNHLEQFSEQVLAAAPEATGTPIEMNVFVDQLRAGYTRAAFYALLIVTLVVVLHFRKLVTSLLCLMPLLIGIMLLLSVMVLFGLDFNAANIIALPLILGIGVDNGILILERFRYEPDIELFSRNTGRAILMSNLSTVTGFVALALARHQGIATLGQIMAIGISLTMLTSLIVLPAAIRLLKRRGIVL